MFFVSIKNPPEAVVSGEFCNYKLCKKINHTITRFSFFAQRTVNVWNSWPDYVDFRSLIY